MCGITGIIPLNKESNISLQEEIKRITKELTHRGPDETGTWLDEENKIALGHRRLSILDLSNEGSQPMSSINQRFVLTFNGEIYNHLSLRDELESFLRKGQNFLDVQWRGTSDTETLLACIQFWGVEKTLQKLVGMFAFALWDKKLESLTLARDRFGEKPLYYGWVDDKFVFASELKAINKISNFKNQICLLALSKYFEFKYVPCPLSIYEGLYKLPPSSYLSISYTNLQKQISALNMLEKVNRYWSLEKVISESENNYFSDFSEGEKILEKALLNSVKDQSIADVELGAFLSGGTDSSLITALLQAQSTYPIKTFTIGFEENNFDESKHAKDISSYLGTDHFELNLSAVDAMNLVPEIAKIYDEPFSDSSQIPTYLVSKYASSNVTVALSGDGGDEVFGGYNRYIFGINLWNKLKFLPFPVRKSIGKFITSFTRKTDNRIDWLHSKFTNESYVTHLSDKVKKTGYGLKSSSDLFGFYKGIATDWSANDQLVKIKSHKNQEILDYWNKKALNNSLKNNTSKMMFWDSMTYLPDDILVKVDRASMANSLETRAPFLDHRLSEIVWRFPTSNKLHNGQGKLLLKNILKKYVPENLTERPKSGFSIPLGEWLRLPLRDWAEDLLNESEINEQGYLNYPLINLAWKDHLSGKSDNSHKLWSILMFQSWLRGKN